MSVQSLSLLVPGEARGVAFTINADLLKLFPRFQQVS
jgi:hypothetical protein